MTTPTLVPDAERRADLLMSRYTRLTEGNPGFHYHLHMRAREHHVADADSITSALVDGPSRRADLIRLLSDDDTYQTWRLRLEHPAWWIGLRAAGTTPLLAHVVSELTPAPGPDVERIAVGVGPDGEPFFLEVSAPHTPIGGAGFVGAHWVNQTAAAIKPLTNTTKAKLAAALRRELLGRNLCSGMAPWVIQASWGAEASDPATAFPESEIDADIDVDALLAAINAVADIHGPEWADAVRTMIDDLDPITWPGITEALINEKHTAARP